MQSLHNCVDINLGHNLQKTFKMRKTLEIQAFLEYSMDVIEKYISVLPVL